MGLIGYVAQKTRGLPIGPSDVQHRKMGSAFGSQHIAHQPSARPQPAWCPGGGRSCTPRAHHVAPRPARSSRCQQLT